MSKPQQEIRVYPRQTGGGKPGFNFCTIKRKRYLFKVLIKNPPTTERAWKPT
jgi:hypothetical protein